jgi:hypothetical protein
VIPFIRDDDRLQQFIEDRGASYLVTFPDWYPHLAQAPVFARVFQGSSILSPQHLTVYTVH